MWLLLGSGAIVFSVVSFFTRDRRRTTWWIFLSLALTSCTLLDFYMDAAKRVTHEDWGGLLDILPTTSKALVVCTLASIVLNAYSLYRAQR